MDKESLLKALEGTLDPNKHVRNSSEQTLHVYEQQPGFTSYLLDLICEEAVQLGTQISAAIFFKNRISNYWVLSEYTKQSSACFISENEKATIKEKLVTTLIKTHNISQVKSSLTTALSSILSYDKWDNIIPLITRLLTSQDKDQIFTGLIVLYELVKSYRWTGTEAKNFVNPVMEDVTQQVFPLIESMANTLVESDSSNSASDEMLYLIVKTFKNATYSSLPSYFQDASKLGSWCQIQLMIINKPLPKEVLEEDMVEQRVTNLRVKTVKWCFANINRLINKHGGGILSAKSDPEFISVFLTNFVPQILNAYWEIIEDWASKKMWLSPVSMYYMISFLEQVIETPCWPLVKEKLDAIIKHLILPSLQASKENIELYEDDPLEYVRRFFDVNREQKTGDVASINFIHRLANKKLKETIALLFGIANDIFVERMNNRENIESAMKTEGALKILSTISYRLDDHSSTCHGQIDKVLDTFVTPELLEEQSSKTPWLTARACDTIAMFQTHHYEDVGVLHNIFQGIIRCFQDESQFPIQLTAADALATLVNEVPVAEQVASQAPQLMENLLEKSKKYESDILTNVMDTFVEKFAKNLEPYAVELGTKLANHFILIGNEILESQSSGRIDEDKELQAGGILNTLTTLVISMSNAKEIGQPLEQVLRELIVFVIENAMVVFLTDVVEILESLLHLRNEVSDIMWSIFKAVLEAFDTYALEYFDQLQPFFTGIINKGFTNPQITMENPFVQSLINVCLNVLKEEETDSVFAHLAFEDIELTILAMNTRIASFIPKVLPEIFDIYNKLDAQDAFDGCMLHRLSLLRILFACVYIDPMATIQLISAKAFLIEFFKLWIQYTDDFQSVYGCKLQLLCAMAIIKSDAIKRIPEDLVGETVDLLLGNLTALPNAIKTKNAILMNETSQKEQINNIIEEGNDTDKYEEIAGIQDEYELDEAEMEALKETPIDKMNAFEEFVDMFLSLKQGDPEKYKVLFDDLNDSKIELINGLIKVTQAH
ncbi:hypothetical protein KGF56_002779 [Candida oxycetoniae]|uniref:Importin N-terminal domain-containing protein n=1 Tax=Candida oxycetoniae TaxID=497107 RepID=A0AAI9SWR7_9ASCO|nr:uncharacterized protein KGF56_002779 [Candida oxycetoniae]KAI3404382.2 hypothetical protein KGF56_002779 [Candida oxycetoniae]